MKRFLALTAMLVMTATFGFGADLTGYLADNKCAVAGKAGNDGHAGCAAACVKKGEPIVLVDGAGKVYMISNQDAVKEHIGHKVTVTGKVDGMSVHVDSVKM